MDINRCGLGTTGPTFYSITCNEVIKMELRKNGIAFLSIDDGESLRKLGNEHGVVIRPRNEGPDGSGISNIRFAPSLVGKGYSSDALYFHTDRSGWDVPPHLLGSSLKSRSAAGGESILADTRCIVKEIKEMNDGLYELLTSSKHASFRSDDDVFVPRPIYDEKSGIFRFRFDDGIQLSAPLVLRFTQLLEIFFRHSFTVALKEGQGYLLDNHRYLHARTSFTGSRELLRVLAYTPQMIVTILFDIDGTLCRSEDLSVDAYYNCLSDIVGTPITQANTTVNLHGRTDLGLLYDILDHHKVDSKAPVVERFLQLHPEYLQKSLEMGFASAPCAGAGDIIEWLAKKQNTLKTSILRVGLLTGNSCPNALLKLRAAGINTDIFDLSISSFGDTHVDRHSLVEDAMTKIRVRNGPDSPESKVIVVGDTPLDVECAKQAGCAVVAVATGNYSMEELAALKPDHICAQLDESKAYFDSQLESLSPVADI
ncbi:HAD-like domain-containing protein [Aspergillus lucknowensis]|uniref:HAD-like domain-containing protein n=1 Tax=Aspergillus lucknowensis TaxID=176173 RepID=A0ABR4LVR9_9EURO